MKTGEPFRVHAPHAQLRSEELRSCRRRRGGSLSLKKR